MNFFDLIDAATTVAVSVLGDFTCTLRDLSGVNPDQTVTGITKNPIFEDDYVPGQNPAPTTVYLFLQLSQLAWIPVRGNVAIVNSVTYNIDRTPTDREGGVTLVLRQQSKAGAGS
jgi:hypothetical protein